MYAHPDGTIDSLGNHFWNATDACCNVNGSSVDDSTFAEVLRWVERDSVGGITVSLGTPIEVAHKLNLLQRRSAVLLLVSCDLESSLMRLESAIYPAYPLETGGATTFPSAMAIAATGRDEDSYDVGRAIAEEGRAAGIHVNFAPTVDVNVNPNNPVIGTRSFGEDPERVARLSAAFVRGTRDGGRSQGRVGRKVQPASHLHIEYPHVSGVSAVLEPARAHNDHRPPAGVP